MPMWPNLQYANISKDGMKTLHFERIAGGVYCYKCFSMDAPDLRYLIISTIFFKIWLGQGKSQVQQLSDGSLAVYLGLQIESSGRRKNFFNCDFAATRTNIQATWLIDSSGISVQYAALLEPHGDDWPNWILEISLQLLRLSLVFENTIDFYIGEQSFEGTEAAREDDVRKVASAFIQTLIMRAANFPPLLTNIVSEETRTIVVVRTTFIIVVSSIMILLIVSGLPTIG